MCSHRLFAVLTSCGVLLLAACAVTPIPSLTDEQLIGTAVKATQIAEGVQKTLTVAASERSKSTMLPETTRTPVQSSTDTPPTSTQIPSVPPVSTDTPITDTPQGTVLGETGVWHQNGMTMWIEHWDGFGFTFDLKNETEGDIYFRLETRDFHIVDKSGRVLREVSQRYSDAGDYKLGPGEFLIFQMYNPAGAPLGFGELDKYCAIVDEAARITNAKWCIDIPH